MKIHGLVLPALLLVAASSGCAVKVATPHSQPGTTFILVRHAEKVADGSRDPALTPGGRARSLALARDLRDEPLRAVLATPYRRTQQTGAPTAALHGLEVTTYDANEPASALGKRLSSQHRHGTVLIVGHSNTVAGIASALCGCEVSPLRDDEYDRRIRIRVAADGRAWLREDRY